MESASPEPKSSKTRGYFNKVRHPSQFSKPQLTVFILAFAVIGYLLVRVFAAAPLIATLESESMTPNIQPTQPAISTLNIGETRVLTNTDSGNANTLLAQKATLGQSATVQSLSFYVRVASGRLRLGIYDATGPNGGPGNLMAYTTYFAVTSVGWDTMPVTSPAPLTAGTYWIAYLTNDNNLGFYKTQDSTSSGVFYHYATGTYGRLPGQFSTSPGKTASHWSFYATLNASSAAPGSASTISDSAASGGKAEKFSAGVSISGTVSLPSVGSSLNVVAHGEQCSTGGWPTMTVSLDGTQVLSTAVSSSSWANYSVTKSMTAGTHSLMITNASSGSCVPNLYADVTNFFGTVTPPTVSLTASPTSISSGGSSTLSWSATNANTCTGTGFSTGNATAGSLKVSPTSSTTYTINCTGDGGSVTQTATVTVSAPAASLNIGDTNILPNSDSGNANTVLAQSTTLSQTATIQSMSFYVTTAAGNLRLGIYDASGPNGGPGKLLASTTEIAPTSVGWDTANVVTPVSLNAGTYWLAYLPSDNNLAFRKNQDSTSNGRYFSYTYGPLPSTFSTSPGTTASHWSLYATLNTSSTVTPPPPPPTLPPSPTGTVYFDGRAKNMTSLLSTGSYSLGTLVQNQSPNLWTGLAFNNNSITLQSDPTFGKVYKYTIGPGNYNPYNTAAANESDSSGELSTRHPGNSLGTTDYYAFAVMVPSGWGGPDWADVISLGYQTAAFDENTIAPDPGPNGVPYWDFYGNAGYVNCPTTVCTGTAYHDHNYMMPVTYNQWIEFALSIKWSTSMDGFIKIYSRPIGGTWKQYVDLENTDNLLYGTTENGTISQNMTSTWLDKQDLYYGYWNTALRSWPTETVYHSGLVRASDLQTAQSTLP